MSFAAARYRSASVETASPVRVVVMLYDGAIRFLRGAAQAMEEKDVAKKGEQLHRAHAIVSELQATLDEKQSPELCDQLSRLYDFVLDRIGQANMKGDPELLGPAVNVLLELRSAWSQVAEEMGG